MNNDTHTDFPFFLRGYMASIKLSYDVRHHAWFLIMEALAATDK